MRAFPISLGLNFWRKQNTGLSLSGSKSRGVNTRTKFLVAKQRNGLARALSMDPELMRFDEPFGALDDLTRSQLQDESLRLHFEEHLAVFMVTHMVDETIYMSDRVVMMNNGPNATIGKILDIDFPRPYERPKVFESAQFAHYRNECIRFLFSRRHGAKTQEPTAVVSSTTTNSGAPVSVPTAATTA